MVAGLFGLGGAWLGSRHEHAKWLRESRLSAYIEFAAVVSRATSVRRTSLKNVRAMLEAEESKQPSSEDKESSGTVRQLGRDEALAYARQYIDELFENIPEDLEAAATRVMLLGPESLDEPVTEMRDAAMQAAFAEGDQSAALDAVQRARQVFVETARAQLAKDTRLSRRRTASVGTGQERLA